MINIPLYKCQFKKERYTIVRGDEFEVSGFIYSSGVHAIEIKNSKGRLVVLPYLGQMIWDAEFLGVNMCMKSMFSEPKIAKSIVETYGCFSFHSGLLRNGCPSVDDDHILHGEMACADIDSAWLEIDESSVTLRGSYEYVMGFGNHYLAQPSITLGFGDSTFLINMHVTNLGAQPMPLQYMCHMNSAYFENAEFNQNIPDSAIKLRESIPNHVTPTPRWLAYNEMLKSSKPIKELDDSEMYDPEIVYFMDDLDRHAEIAIFEMKVSDSRKFITEFDTKQFNYATRWILYNPDQSVGAYVLPATCRPEGYLAAKKSETLIYLDTNQTREFSVKTGIEVIK